MKKKTKVPRKKLPLEWAEESFGFVIALQPVTSGALCRPATQFLRPEVTCTGNPALRASVSDVAA